jgi:Tfp pilus assembly protein PilV
MGEKGLSLIEILVSCIILALILTGLVNIFIAGKRYILHSRSRMTTVELGRFFLDPLQMHVRQGESVPGTAQDGWDQVNNLLQIPATQESWSWVGTQENLDNIYTPTYTVSRVKDTGLRRVRVSINWTERAP